MLAHERQRWILVALLDPEEDLLGGGLLSLLQGVGRGGARQHSHHSVYRRVEAWDRHAVGDMDQAVGRSWSQPWSLSPHLA